MKYILMLSGVSLILIAGKIVGGSMAESPLSVFMHPTDFKSNKMKEIRLAWTESRDDTVRGYAVYCQETNKVCQRMEEGMLTTATLYLIKGNEYTVYVTSIGTLGLESEPSETFSISP